MSISFGPIIMNSPETLPNVQKAVRWHPPSYDIRVEDVPVPRYKYPLLGQGLISDLTFIGFSIRTMPL